MEITKRFERILGIYFHLQSKPIVTGQELSDKFEVSLRTIYRDLKSLEQAGIPLLAEVGIGYSLVSTYKIPPISFSKEEALSFGIAEKLMNHYLDKDLAQSFDSALLKMKSVLKYSLKEHIADLSDKVLIRKEKDFLNGQVPKALSLLFESIVKKQQLQLFYKSNDSKEIIERYIEPIGVFQESKYWYFMAYCHLRKEIRQFRLDRIHRIELFDKPFQNEYLPLYYYLIKESRREKEVIRIRANKKITNYLKWDRGHFGFFEEKMTEDGVEMTFETSYVFDYFARWFLSFADEAEILEPLTLKKRVFELLEKAVQKQQD